MTPNLPTIPDIATWSHAPCALVCRCGTSHVAAIENSLTGRARADVLKRSASAFGWYEVKASAADRDGDWTCPTCYITQLGNALMLHHTGQASDRKKLDRAADDRVDWLRMVRR